MNIDEWKDYLEDIGADWSEVETKSSEEEARLIVWGRHERRNRKAYPETSYLEEPHMDMIFLKNGQVIRREVGWTRVIGKDSVVKKVIENNYLYLKGCAQFKVL